VTNIDFRQAEAVRKIQGTLGFTSNRTDGAAEWITANWPIPAV